MINRDDVNLKARNIATLMILDPDDMVPLVEDLLIEIEMLKKKHDMLEKDFRIIVESYAKDRS